MNDDIRDIICYFEKLMKIIEQKSYLIPFSKLLSDPLLVTEFNSINKIYCIVNNSLQVGNYRRALRYIVLLSKIKDDLLESEQEIRGRMTEYVLG